MAVDPQAAPATRRGDVATGGGYPPEGHLLRALGIWIERGESEARCGLELVPQLLGPSGDLRAGVLATLADVASGELAMRELASSGWGATSSLVLHRLREARGGGIEARAELLRRTRQSLLLEVEIGDGGGALQGGVAALLAELAAEAAGAAALGSPVRVDDLALDYVSLAREGPVRTTARTLRSTGDLSLLRVELRDGAARLATLASAQVSRSGSGAGRGAAGFDAPKTQNL